MIQLPQPPTIARLHSLDEAEIAIKSLLQWADKVKQILETHATGSHNDGTATSATAGANGAVPAQVAGYLVTTIAGVSQKIPFFNV